MSEPIKTAGLTRRSFLKATGAVAGATALAGGAGSLTALAEEESHSTSEDEKVCDVACFVNCVTMSCGMKAHVRDGKIYKVTRKTGIKVPEEVPDYEYDRLPCLRGRSHIQWIYHPDRIKYPMRRIGERGEDKWERISWSEAIKEIAEKFNGYQQEYGKQSIAVPVMWGNSGLVNGQFGAVSRLINGLHGTNLDCCLDIGFPVGTMRVTGELYNGNNSFWNSVNSKTIFMWGVNYTDAILQSWHWVPKAQEKGAKVICIDPRFSIMASKADQWVPIKQGTDSSLILAMINWAIKNGKTDYSYMQQHTVAPFLVREDNGKFLRMSDLGVAPIEGPVDKKTGKPELIDPAVVVDADTGEMKSEKECSNPINTGTYSINGINVTTAYDLLANKVKDFTIEKAAADTGLDQAVVEELARTFAEDGPVNIKTGYGLDRYNNGDILEHSLAALMSITGNYGINGGGMGLDSTGKGTILSTNVSFMMPDMKNPAPKVPWLCLPDVLETGTYNGKEWPIKALLNVCGNAISNQTQQKEFLEEILPKIEFIVTHDSRMNDSARYSDIVLPATHYFEEWDLCGSTWLHINEKAIDPLYEAKSDYDFFKDLTQEMGLKDLFDKSAYDVVKSSIDDDLACQKNGITFDRLTKEKSIFNISPEFYDGIAYHDFNFKTPSGRLEFYQESPKPRMDYGQKIDEESIRLPSYSHPEEAWVDNPLHEMYPLVAYQEHPRWRVHSSFGDLSWLREFDPEPVVKLNPLDAEKRGIQSGDTVRAFNDRGEVVLKARIDPGLPEGMCNIPKGWQRDQFISGGYQELTSRMINPVSLNQAYNEVLVEVEKTDR